MSSQSPDQSLHHELEYRLEQNVLFVAGILTLHQVEHQGKKVTGALQNYVRRDIYIDLSELKSIDSAGVTFINHLKKSLKKRNIIADIINIPENIRLIMDTFSVPSEQEEYLSPRENIFVRIGESAYYFFASIFREYIFLMADLFYWSIADLFRNKSAHRKGEFINQAVLIGINAVPVIGLISLLIGLVLALQSAAQLRQFGANIFMVDLIVIAMTREMGPLLTAIMIAGRSGSAIASEVATMVVTEEVDALKSMALNPIRYVVVPKMHASIFTMPLLTILADMMGILGGIIISYFYLDLSLPVFYNRMAEVLLFKDIMIGAFKSIVFATLIVQTGSYYGFHVSGGAEAVGRFTTAAVVTSIFLVILADSIIGLIFY